MSVINQIKAIKDYETRLANAPTGGTVGANYDSDGRFLGYQMYDANDYPVGGRLDPKYVTVSGPYGEDGRTDLSFNRAAFFADNVGEKPKGDKASLLKQALAEGQDLRPLYGEGYADAVQFKDDLGQYADKDPSMIIPANPLGYSGQFKFDPNFGSSYYRDLATQAGRALGLSDDQILKKGTEYFADKFASGGQNKGVVGFTDFGKGLMDQFAITAGVPQDKLAELRDTSLKPIYDASNQVFQGLNTAARVESNSSGVFKSIGESISKLGPLGTIALTAALGPAAGALSGALGGGAALATGLAAAGAGALPGILQGDISGGLKSGLTSGLLAGVGAGALKDVGASAAKLVGGGTAGNIVGGAASGAVTGGIGSLLSGKDLGEGLLSGAVGGGVGGAAKGFGTFVSDSVSGALESALGPETAKLVGDSLAGVGTGALIGAAQGLVSKEDLTNLILKGAVTGGLIAPADAVKRSVVDALGGAVGAVIGEAAKGGIQSGGGAALLGGDVGREAFNGILGGLTKGAADAFRQVQTADMGGGTGITPGAGGITGLAPTQSQADQFGTGMPNGMLDSRREELTQRMLQAGLSQPQVDEELNFLDYYSKALYQAKQEGVDPETAGAFAEGLYDAGRRDLSGLMQLAGASIPGSYYTTPDKDGFTQFTAEGAPIIDIRGTSDTPVYEGLGTGLSSRPIDPNSNNNSSGTQGNLTELLSQLAGVNPSINQGVGSLGGANIAVGPIAPLQQVLRDLNLPSQALPNTPSAGTPSAGTPSAGTPSAGTPSAGTPSAGTPDVAAAIKSVTDALSQGNTSLAQQLSQQAGLNSQQLQSLQAAVATGNQQAIASASQNTQQVLAGLNQGFGGVSQQIGQVSGGIQGLSDLLGSNFGQLNSGIGGLGTQIGGQLDKGFGGVGESLTRVGDTLSGSFNQLNTTLQQQEAARLQRIEEAKTAAQAAQQAKAAQEAAQREQQRNVALGKTALALAAAKQNQQQFAAIQNQQQQANAPSTLALTPTTLNRDLGFRFEAPQYDMGVGGQSMQQNPYTIINPQVGPTPQYVRGFAEGGRIEAINGGIGSIPMGGRFLQGPGDGMSDDIPASIDGEEDVMLTDGEYIVPAQAVSALGNGSSKAGAQVLDAMVKRVYTQQTGKPKQMKPINKKVLPA